MNDVSPPAPRALRLPPDSGWEDIAPYYVELDGRVIDAGSVERYLADWTALAGPKAFAAGARFLLARGYR